MLFNFQSPVSFVHSLEVNSFIISRGFEFVKHFFWKSFKFFVLLSATKKHSIFSLPWGLLTSCDVLSRWQLIYNIMPKLFCQHLFSKKYNFFEKNREIPLFPPFYAGLQGSIFLKFPIFCCKIALIEDFYVIYFRKKELFCQSIFPIISLQNRRWKRKTSSSFLSSALLLRIFVLWKS